MPAQQESWIATAYLESGTITRGYVACLNEAGTKYVVASAANRSSEGRRSACIALTSGDADDPGGSSFEAQYVGVVPPSITGLGAGTATLVRVSDAGVLERTDAYSTSDDVCGHCDEDGTAYVCFPLVGLGAALGASSAPGLPQNSVQYYLDANTLGGSAKAFINPTDGALEIRTSSETAAASGDMRFAAGKSVRTRSNDGTRDVNVWSHGVDIASGGDVILLGSGVVARQPTEAGTWSKFYASIQVGSFGASENQAAVLAIGPGRAGATGTGATARVAAACPNFFIGRQPRFAALTADPVNGGIGIEFHEDQTTVPTAAPTGGYYRRSNPSNHHPEVLLPGDDPSTGWRDLLATGSAGDETDSDTITASPTGSLDMTGLGHLDSQSASSTVTIDGFVAPAAGKAKRFTIHNNNGDSATLVLKYESASADATEDRIFLNSSTDLIISAGETYVVSYSESRSRWVVAKGVA